MFSSDPNNIFYQAKDTTFELYNDWIAGDALLANALTVNNQPSAAITNLQVLLGSSDDLLSIASLQTISGTGCTDITHVNDLNSPHRTISGSHRSLGGTDKYLDQNHEEFRGQIDLSNVRSWAGSGISGGERLNAPRWVGDKHGTDLDECRF